MAINLGGRRRPYLTEKVSLIPISARRQLTVARDGKVSCRELDPDSPICTLPGGVAVKDLAVETKNDGTWVVDLVPLLAGAPFVSDLAAQGAEWRLRQGGEIRECGPPPASSDCPRLAEDEPFPVDALPGTDVVWLVALEAALALWRQRSRPPPGLLKRESLRPVRLAAPATAESFTLTHTAQNILVRQKTEFEGQDIEALKFA